MIFIHLNLLLCISDYVIMCINTPFITHRGNMRTNIVIDDKLMTDALSVSGLKTKKEAVEEGLKALIRLRKQANIRSLRGKLNWDGDLNDMRTTE
jgi:Arc/MetJ family transcription regulator